MLSKCFILASKAILVVVVGMLEHGVMAWRQGNHSSRRYTVFNVEASF